MATCVFPSASVVRFFTKSAPIVGYVDFEIFLLLYESNRAVFPTPGSPIMTTFRYEPGAGFRPTIAISKLIYSIALTD